MHSRRRSPDNKSSNAQVDMALAVLIGNTRRTHRPNDLVEVARWLEIARRELGGLHQVAERVGVSEQMLRDFTAVDKLPSAVRKLLKERAIDSVDIACRLARLPTSHQLEVAKAVACRRLDGNDVRDVVSLRKTLPDVGIREIIQRVEDSRDIKEYLAEFIVPAGDASPDALRARFAGIVGEENVRSLRRQGKVGVLAMNSEGRRRLQEAAKNRGMTKREIIDELLVEGAGQRGPKPG